MKRALIIAGLTAGAVWMYHKRGSVSAGTDNATSRNYYGPKRPKNPKKGDLWFTGENVRIASGRLSAKHFNMINYRPKSNHENQL